MDSHNIIGLPAPRPSCMMDLNDFCIMTILRYFTDVIGFLNAALTCDEMKEIATMTYRYMHVNHFGGIRIGYKGSDFAKKGGALPIDRMDDFLSLFGHLVTSLKLGRLHPLVFESIVKVCGKNLNQLKLNDCYYKYDMSDPSKFPKLENLSFHGVLPKSFALHSSLKGLTFKRLYDLPKQEWFMKAFPKLEHIKFHEILDLKDQQLGNFLELNPNVKKLDLSHCAALTPQVVELIARHSPDLEHLGFLRLNKKK